MYACANCMQNTRLQLMRAIDAKLCFYIMFQNTFRNIERQKQYLFLFLFFYFLFIYFFFFFNFRISQGLKGDSFCFSIMYPILLTISGNKY